MDSLKWDLFTEFHDFDVLTGIIDLKIQGFTSGFRHVLISLKVPMETNEQWTTDSSSCGTQWCINNLTKDLVEST